jgi:hypothetical protein
MSVIGILRQLFVGRDLLADAFEESLLVGVSPAGVLTIMHHSRCGRSVEDDSSRVPLPGG